RLGLDDEIVDGHHLRMPEGARDADLAPEALEAHRVRPEVRVQDLHGHGRAGPPVERPEHRGRHAGPERGAEVVATRQLHARQSAAASPGRIAVAPGRVTSRRTSPAGTARTPIMLTCVGESNCSGSSSLRLATRPAVMCPSTTSRHPPFQAAYATCAES